METEKNLNRVVYCKNIDPIKNIITADFVIINNNKIFCPLNIIDGKIEPSICLYNDERMRSYTFGLQEAIPQLMRYTISPNKICIDLISEKFDTNLVDNKSSTNLIQYHLNDKYTKINQFYKVDDPICTSITIPDVKISPITYEERIYLNLYNGFIFGIVNAEYKLLYISVQDISNDFIDNLHSQKDIGVISRLFKFWPELNLNIVIQSLKIDLKSAELKEIFKGSSENGVYYIFNKINSPDYVLSIPFIRV